MLNNIQSLNYDYSLITPEEFTKHLSSGRALNQQGINLPKIEEMAKAYPTNRPLQILTYAGVILSGNVGYVTTLWSLAHNLNTIATWGNYPLLIPGMTKQVQMIQMSALAGTLLFTLYNEKYSMGNLIAQAKSSSSH